MNELQEVCKTYLDNADLSLSVNGNKGVIKLEFFPAGYNGAITFFCSDYSRLNFRKYSDDEDLIFVGETHVKVISNKTEITELYKEDGWSEINQELLKLLKLLKLLNSVVLIEIEVGVC